MARIRNTDRYGRSFPESIVEAVWNKAIPTSKPDYRKDKCGATIYRHSHGKTSTYGWEIDHITPVALGGTDNLSNLQPLQWENNRKKSDNLQFTCAVTS